jgi:RNA polymerase sigma factor (sigma-70 family)
LTLQETFVAQIQAHRGLLNKLVYLYADSPEDRKDLQQEILLQAWRSFPGFRAEAKFSTWLYRIGLNTSLSLLSQRKKDAEMRHPAGEKTSGHSFEADDQLMHVLKQVSPLDRTLLVMYMEGYTPEEICETLGLQAGTMRTRLHRVRKKVEELWIS